MGIEKRTFKICESVRLGLDYYYMSYKKRVQITDADIEFARKVIPTLPEMWWEEPQDWQVFGKKRGKND